MRTTLALAGLPGEERASQEIRGGQREEIALVMHEAALEKRDRGLPTQALDVHGAAGGHVEKPLSQLRGAGARIRTADVDVAFLFRRELCAALRARGRHDERALAAVPHLDDRTEYLRNHVSGLAQEDHVADEDSFAFDLFRVVQRRHGDSRTGHLGWLHHGEGRHASRSSNIDLDVPQSSAHDLGGVLVGDSPPWRPRRRPQPLLNGKIVDLDDHAVDLVFHVMPVLAVVADVLLDAGEVGHKAPTVTRRQTEVGENVVRPTQRGEGDIGSFVRTDAVNDEA